MRDARGASAWIQRWRSSRRGFFAGGLIRAVAALAVLSAAALASAGDIQVLCEAGLRVMLNGRLVGISSAREDGLFLVGVPVGVHTLTVEKDGYRLQTFRVEVSEHPIEIAVGEFVRELPSPAEGAFAPAKHAETSATVVITSAPQNCDVELDGVLHGKRTPQLVLSGVAPGDHEISFAKDGYPPIRGKFAARPGVKTAVRGNLIDGQVEVVHAGVGSLRVFCRPDRCRVRFRGQLAETSRGRWNLSHVPAGEHQLVVSLRGQERAAAVVIADGRRTVVSVSFLPGEEPIAVSYQPE